MALNFNIPMPDIEGSFAKGYHLNDDLMKQILERHQLKQLDEHFKKEYGLKAAAAGRNAQLFPFRLQELKDKHAAAEFERNMMSQLLGAGSPMGGQDSNEMPQEKKFMPTEEVGQGMGALSPETIQQGLEEQKEQSSKPTQHGLDPKFAALMQNPMMRGWFKHKFGYDPLAPVAQTPEQKQSDKMALESYKTEQKKILEQEKANLKHEATRQKTIDTASNDLPHLEDTIDALDKMELIAKNNPDLFGHSGIMGFGAEGAADRFSKTTDNPNAGAFQAYLTGPIANGVKELSTRGNQLALKTILGIKPNFSESQGSAMAKIKAMRDIVNKQIEHTRHLAGKVVIINPEGKRFTTTAENAAHLPNGWKRG